MLLMATSMLEALGPSALVSHHRCTATLARWSSVLQNRGNRESDMPNLDESVDVVQQGAMSTSGGAAVLGKLVSDGRLPTVLAGAASWHAQVDRLRLTRNGSVEIRWISGPMVDDVAHLLIAALPGLARRVVSEDHVLLSYEGLVPVELRRMRRD